MNAQLELLGGEEGASAAPRSLAWALVPGVLLAGVSAGIAFPIFPQAGLKAGLSVTFIGALLAANRLARLAAAPLLGRLADRVELKRLIVGGLAGQCVTMACYTLGVSGAHTGAWLMAGRLLHGPAAAAVMIGAQALTLKERRGSAIGAVRAAMSVGLPLGVVIGGLLSRAVGDAQTFTAALAAMIGAAVVAGRWLPSARRSSGIWPEWRMTDTRLIDTRLAGARLPDTTLPDTRLTDARLTDARLTDARLTDARLTDTRLTDTRLTDTRSPDTRLTDTRSPDTRLPDTRLTDTRLTDTRLTDTRSRRPRHLLLGVLNGAVTFTALGIVLTATSIQVASRDLRLGPLDSKSTASALLGLMVLAMGLSTLAIGRLARSPSARVRAVRPVLGMLGVSLLTLGLATTTGALAAGLLLCGAAAGALSALVLAVLKDRVDERQEGRAAGFNQLCGDLGGVLGPLAGSALLALGPAAPFLCAAGVVGLLLLFARHGPTP